MAARPGDRPTAAEVAALLSGPAAKLDAPRPVAKKAASSQVRSESYCIATQKSKYRVIAHISAWTAMYQSSLCHVPELPLPCTRAPSTMYQSSLCACSAISWHLAWLLVRQVQVPAELHNPRWEVVFGGLGSNSAVCGVQVGYAERLQLQSLYLRAAEVVYGGADAAADAGWELPDLESIVDVRRCSLPPPLFAATGHVPCQSRRLPCHLLQFVMKDYAGVFVPILCVFSHYMCDPALYQPILNA